MKNQYILSIDQGTTGTRAVLYDKNGEQVAVAYKGTTSVLPKTWLGRA